jgi:hypothetical protein
LTAGLFASVKDREVECRVDGCKNTWVWFGSQQVRAMGKPPPPRMCDDHLAQFNDLGDKQMPCRNSWCDNTWLWKRGAQLHAVQRQGKARPPHRQCDRCFDDEKSLADQEMTCKMSGCERTWTWTRDAQVRHRAWSRRQQAKIASESKRDSVAPEPSDPEASTAESSPAAASTPPKDPSESPGASEQAANESPAAIDPGKREEPAESKSESRAPAAEETPQADVAQADAAQEDAAQEDAAQEDAGDEAPASEPVEDTAPSSKRSAEGKKRKRKRRRKKKISDGPPEKMCKVCADKFSTLVPAEQPCKVHGCSRTWMWDRGSQMRVWLNRGGKDDGQLPSPSRRMCESCRDFVRAHPDREVVCGRPECEKTWTYKTGAQLQAFLAGRKDPIRLCEECVRSQFVAAGAGQTLPPGAESLPCVVRGCEGTWIYIPGMKLASAAEGEEPPDRMCDPCRGERGHAPRSPEPSSAEPSLATDDSGNAQEIAAELGGSPGEVPAAAAEPEKSPSAASADESGTLAASEVSSETPEPSAPAPTEVDGAANSVDAPDDRSPK